DMKLRELSGEEAWEAIENFAQGKKEWDNPPNTISEQELANLKAQAKRLFGNENVWVEIHRGIAWDKVENPSPQSTPQVLLLFEVYTPPVTYPKEVKETLGTPIEVEPLDKTQLEDLVLNICNNDFPLSSMEVPNLGDPKEHYEFKPGLLGHGGSLGVDLSKLEMIEDDFLGEGLSLPVRPKVVGKVIFDEKKLGSSQEVSLDDSQRMI
ncbi:hypothetical protein Tco_0281050, partial [Tanacetum coccineum]